MQLFYGNQSDNIIPQTLFGGNYFCIVDLVTAKSLTLF